MTTRATRFGFIFNGNKLLLVRHTRLPDQNRDSFEVAYVVNAAGTPTLGRLHNFAYGLLLGVTIMALEDAGVDIGSLRGGGEDEEEEGEDHMDVFDDGSDYARESTDITRPGAAEAGGGLAGGIGAGSSGNNLGFGAGPSSFGIQHPAEPRPSDTHPFVSSSARPPTPGSSPEAETATLPQPQILHPTSPLANTANDFQSCRPSPLDSRRASTKFAIEAEVEANLDSDTSFDTLRGHIPVPIRLPDTPVSSPPGFGVNVRHPDQLGPDVISLQIPSYPVWGGKHYTLLPRTTLPPLYGPVSLPFSSDQVPSLVAPASISKSSASDPTLCNPPRGRRRHLSLEIAAFRGRGAIWDTYSVRPVQVRERAASTVRLVVKLTDRRVTNTNNSTVEEKEHRTEVTQGGEDEYADVRRAISNETRLYSAELAPLQGQVVPRFWGLMGGIISSDTCTGSDSRGDGNKEVWCAVLEDAGRELEPYEKSDFAIQYVPWIFHFRPRQLTILSARPHQKTHPAAIHYASRRRGGSQRRGVAARPPQRISYTSD